jgi:predicted permease
MLTPGDDGGARTSFGAAQDAPSASRGADGPVAVISHRLWRQRFAGAHDVVGRQLTVQRVPFTIVGVMPPGFFGPDVGRMTDVMLPFAAEPLIRGSESRLAAKTSWWLQIMVRLKPGQSLDQANAALRVLQAQITEGASRQLQPFTFVAAATGNSSLRSRFETPLLAMVVAVGLVLLVACANIASLMLARTLARRREFSVRLALGSSRWRIARLLFIESLIVAVTGAAVGLAFASWSSALLVQQLSTWQSTVSLDLAPDLRVLAFTAALACLAALIAAVAPVLGLKRVAAGEALKESGRGITGDGRFSVRGTLVVAQIAVSFALVVAAGLFLHTFASLNQLPLGFVPEPLLVAELNLQPGGGPPQERGARVERLRDATAAVPGVRSVAVSSVRLLTGGGWSSGMVAIGDGSMSRIRPTLWLNGTTPGWFETMGIPLRSGRDFEAGDRVGSRPVAIVNETFVRRFLPGEQPIGQSVRLGFEPDTRYEIVGVVGDTVYTTPREGMLATMYVAMAQRKPSEFWPTVLLTANTAPGIRAVVEREIAEALRRADPAIAFTFGTFDRLVESTVTQERLIALVSAFFGGLALLLAAVGLYGVVAHAVRARQREIGLRIALGATPSSILGLVFERVGLLIAAGLGLGLIGSLWAVRFLEALLFHLEPRDPMTFAGAAALLVAVGVLAAWLPAHRAARLDPVTVLREG